MTRLQTLGLILFGVVFGLVMLFVLIRLFPALEPGGQRFIFRVYDGDTFRHQPGLVRPPAENTTLEDVVRRDDPDGFRRPQMTADFYPIIAIGDSFTDGGQVPWTDVLAESLNTPVRNLGWSGFGPLEYRRVMEDYGGENHEWVIVAYFEGNDLSNIRTTRQRADENNGIIPLDLSRTVAPPVTVPPSLAESGITLNTEDSYLYPLTHPGANPFEMAYISDYLWWLNADEDTYRNSRNITELRDALATIQTLAGEACVALMYIPNKEHIYFPRSDPQGNRRYVMDNALELVIGEDGWLTFTPPAPQPYETLAPRLDNQRNVVREVALELGLQFIDLTPVMQATTTPVYYAYDSHWSIDGHRLAGETAAGYIRGADCP